ncbi:unnamed protein product [Meloidogyne enterolobii]|uniref:Uncharacterized protein n=1 Tax=Meloidogyne enterolobii TaxID=390850 RepID=A0ACB0ZHW0_MELEN
MSDEQSQQQEDQDQGNLEKDTNSQQTQQQQKPHEQSPNFVPRVGFLQPPRHRYPMPGNSFPPPNGGGPPPGQYQPLNQLRPPPPNFRPMPPNYQMQGPHYGDGPPHNYFGHQGPPRFHGQYPPFSSMNIVGGPPQNMGPPNMGPGQGGPPRPPMGGGGRPPFPQGGYPGGPMPPGFRPPMGMPPMPYGMRPQMHQPPQNGHQQNGQPPSQPQQAQQQPVSQNERLKKILGISVEKELWIETKSAEGKSYFYQSETRQTVWERPDASNAVVMQQDEIQKAVDQSQREEKEQQMQQHHGAGPPGGMPPFMMPPGFPGGPTNPNDAWQEFTSQDGKKYYFNFITRENTWTKPKALIDKEAAIRENGGVPPQMAGFPGGVPMMGGAAMSPMGIGYAGFRPSAGTGGPQAALTNPQGGQKDKSRPVTSNAVAGTPWCVVWTGDNRVFFFNPSTRTSVWERPPELYNRPDVDLLVSKPPPAKEQLSNRAQKRLQKEESEEEVDEDDEIEVHESDTSNSDEENQKKMPAHPPKKKSRKDKKVEEELKMQLENPKQQKLALPVLQQEKPIDPAIQAELEAQKERDKVPLEERIKQFRQLLEDKKVSATSTWEKELSKIVFDQRYLLLSAVERKAAFDAYCRERAEIEKEEKRKKAKEAKAEFYKLLDEAKLHGKSTFSSFSTNSKWAKDPRFKAVEKVRDREAYFKDFVEQLYKKEKEEKRKERDKAKECFVALLKEQEYLRRNSVWAVVKKKIDKDERYRNKNLDSETRQKLFDEHAKTCPEPTEEEEAEAKRLEEEALEAANAAKEKALNEKHENEERDRERRKNNSSSNNNNSSSSRRREKEKEKSEKTVEKTAEEKALEDRKRQVEEELGEHLKERNREHERHKLLEHEQNFKALLADLVRSTDISWHDGRKLLKKDSRYQNCELLDKESKERLFREHIRDLERKKRDLLDEHQLITFTTKWHNARKTIIEDDRVAKLKLDERKLEHEYREWMERRHRQALDDFEALLRETKIITYKSKQMITENEQHLRDILAVLENDTRYLVLKERPSERERILDEYLDLLDRKGPPPPPTRNEDPDRRRK